MFTSDLLFPEPTYIRDFMSVAKWDDGNGEDDFIWSSVFPVPTAASVCGCCPSDFEEHLDEDRCFPPHPAQGHLSKVGLAYEGAQQVFLCSGPLTYCWPQRP